MITIALRCCLFCCAMLPLLAWSQQEFEVRVSDQKPQSRQHFVQGLEIVDGQLYLSAGNYGESGLLRYNFYDGKLDKATRLNANLFAEGLTVLGDRVYQLTWRNQAMLVYRKSDLHFEQSLPLPGEGWGLTNDGTQLIYSDGSDKLHFMSPETAVIMRSITVTERGKPVNLLNELEWVDGIIWANIWRSDRIVLIDPLTGNVTASVNLQGLLPQSAYRPGTDVLNGIARDPTDGGIWVTGKRWPWMYRIELLPVDDGGETEQRVAVSR
jgi:glutamine cyclotransferase